MLDFLPQGKRERVINFVNTFKNPSKVMQFLHFPFVKVFLEGHFNEKVFESNFHSFETQLKSIGLDKDQIKRLKDFLLSVPKMEEEQEAQEEEQKLISFEEALSHFNQTFFKGQLGEDNVRVLMMNTSLNPFRANEMRVGGLARSIAQINLEMGKDEYTLSQKGTELMRNLYDQALSLFIAQGRKNVEAFEKDKDRAKIASADKFFKAANLILGKKLIHSEQVKDDVLLSTVQNSEIKVKLNYLAIQCGLSRVISGSGTYSYVPHARNALTIAHSTEERSNEINKALLEVKITVEYWSYPLQCREFFVEKTDPKLFEIDLSPQDSPPPIVLDAHNIPSNIYQDLLRCRLFKQGTTQLESGGYRCARWAHKLAGNL